MTEGQGSNRRQEPPPPPPLDPDPDVIGHMENDERWLRRYVESARRAHEAARTVGRGHGPEPGVSP